MNEEEWTRAASRFVAWVFQGDPLLSFLGTTVLYDSERQHTDFSAVRQSVAGRQNVAFLLFSQDGAVYGFCVRRFPADDNFVRDAALLFVASDTLSGGNVPYKSYPSRYATVTIRDDSLTYAGSGSSGPGLEEILRLAVPSCSDGKARYDVATYEWDAQIDNWDLDRIDTTLYTCARVLVVQFSASFEIVLEHFGKCT